MDFRSNSMVAGTHLDTMADALKMADFALLHCTAPSLNLDALCRAKTDKSVTAYRAVEPLLQHLQTVVAPGDIVACMSNGSFQAIQGQILTMLNECCSA